MLIQPEKSTFENKERGQHTVYTVKAPSKEGDLTNRILNRIPHVPENRTVPYTYRINRIPLS